MSNRHIATVAAVLTTTSALTGLSVQFGVVDTSRIRWVHHALYGASLASTAVAAVQSIRAAKGSSRSATSRLWEVLRDATLPATVALLALPRTRGGTRGHAVLGSIAVACHAVGAVNGARSSQPT